MWRENEVETKTFVQHAAVVLDEFAELPTFGVPDGQDLTRAQQGS